MSPTVGKIKASADGCGRARTADCRRVGLHKGRETDGRGGERKEGGEGCGGDCAKWREAVCVEWCACACGKAGGGRGREGGDPAGALFSGEGPVPVS